MNLIESFELNTISSNKDAGKIIAMENHEAIPFDIKRVYFIYGNKSGEPRGFHAHRKLYQIALCIQGSCKMVCDDMYTKEEILLDKPNLAVKLPPMIWHEMHDFSHDCILLVIASDTYDEADYIRDYAEFKRLRS